MRFNDFKDIVSRFLELNYKFEMKNGFMFKNYKDFQLVICIVKSSLGKHYKILSNFYVPEFHSYKELISMKDCEKIFHEDLQNPENFFSNQLLKESNDEIILYYIKNIFDKLLANINREGINYLYNKKEKNFFSADFKEFMKFKKQSSII